MRNLGEAVFALGAGLTLAAMALTWPAAGFQPSDAQIQGIGSQTDIPGVNHLTPCFVPGNDCQAVIVQVIEKAEQQIFVQAYSFTSEAISDALIGAMQRGVNVTVVLDKSQRREHFSVAAQLNAAGIPVWIDEKPAIAHNKVIVVDQLVTITGSFNFTKSAQTRNAENLVLIVDQRVAKAYLDNITSRIEQSVPFR